MIDTTKKLNIISLEELKGEIKNENESGRGEHRSPISEKFFIEKNINENNNNNDTVATEQCSVTEQSPVAKQNSISENDSIQEKPNLKNSFIENKKKIKKDNNIVVTENSSVQKNKKIEFNKDLKQINKKESKKNIVYKTDKIKSVEKIYINIQEASKISGISKNTIRKSLKSNELSYFFENGKYSLELENFLKWIFQSTRRINMINTKGLGKFIETWKMFL